MTRDSQSAKDAKDAIEQAVARGWTAEFIHTHLGFDETTIDQVLWDMDVAVSEVTVPNPRKPRVEPLPCGTYAGYRRHQRKRSRACPPCKAAYAVYREGERANRRGDT